MLKDNSHILQKLRLPFRYGYRINFILLAQYALSALANTWSRGNYFFEDLVIPSCSEALLQKSTSISRRPIFSYNAFSRLSASSSGALVSKISAPRDRNSRFQFDIIWGWTSNRLASSLRVSSSLIASMATWALKAAVCFFLVFFILDKFNTCFKLNQSGTAIFIRTVS